MKNKKQALKPYATRTGFVAGKDKSTEWWPVKDRIILKMFGIETEGEASQKGVTPQGGYGCLSHNVTRNVN